MALSKPPASGTDAAQEAPGKIRRIEPAMEVFSWRFLPTQKKELMKCKMIINDLDFDGF